MFSILIVNSGTHNFSLLLKDQTKVRFAVAYMCSWKRHFTLAATLELCLFFEILIKLIECKVNSSYDSAFSFLDQSPRFLHFGHVVVTFLCNSSGYENDVVLTFSITVKQ